MHKMRIIAPVILLLTILSFPLILHFNRTKRIRSVRKRDRDWKQYYGKWKYGVQMGTQAEQGRKTAEVRYKGSYNVA